MRRVRQAKLAAQQRPSEAGFGAQGGDPSRGVDMDLSTCVNRYGPAPAAIEALHSIEPADIVMHPYDAAERLIDLYRWATDVHNGAMLAGRGASEFIWAMGRELDHGRVHVPLPAYTDYLKAFPGGDSAVPGAGATVEQIDAALGRADWSSSPIHTIPQECCSTRSDSSPPPTPIPLPRSSSTSRISASRLIRSAGPRWVVTFRIWLCCSPPRSSTALRQCERESPGAPTHEQLKQLFGHSGELGPFRRRRARRMRRGAGLPVGGATPDRGCRATALGWPTSCREFRDCGLIAMRTSISSMRFVNARKTSPRSSGITASACECSARRTARTPTPCASSRRVRTNANASSGLSLTWRQPLRHQVKRNQRSAHSAATAPHAASTATPNQSTDSVIACDSASVSAPDGVSRATHCSAVRHHAALQRQRAEPGEDEPQQVGQRQHDLGRSVPPSSRPSAAKRRGAERDDHRPEQQPDDVRAASPAQNRWRPTGSPAGTPPSTTASDLPAMMPHTGSAVAPSRFSAP